MYDDRRKNPGKRRSRWLSAALAAVVVWAGVALVASPKSVWAQAPPAPEFVLTASASPLTVARGANVTFTIQYFTSTTQYTDMSIFFATNLTGMNATFVSQTVHPGWDGTPSPTGARHLGCCR